ncbi:MAG: hypothetical protein JWP69_1599 [Flaviaesturariibacter sp.]|nr:hypothetical protein [Flaviaesturariibacter sp.]
MRKYVLSVVAVVAVFIFSSWGFLVHRTATQLAVYQLPKDLQPFFHENMGELVKNSVRPDQRRNSDKTEAPKHYIDLEPFGDSAAWKMPYEWQTAIATYTKDSLEKYGYVPYVVVMMKERLTNAFRMNNRDSILFYAADMAHYIEDANVPLHTSINHDGQLTNQKGLHSLWESFVPEIELTNYNLYSSHKAKYLPHPEVAIWNSVRTAHQLLPQLFAEEREASKGFVDSTKYRVQMRNGRESRSYTTVFAKAYSQRLGNTINQQLLNSANMLSDFWYTSWVDAGKPNLNGLLKAEWTKTKKKAWKREYKSYKRNKLQSDSLLISRQRLEGTE